MKNSNGIMKEFWNAFIVKGGTWKQRIAVWWFSLSLCLLCSTEDAPLWFLGLEALNFFFATRYLKKHDVPECFKEYEQSSDEE